MLCFRVTWKAYGTNQRETTSPPIDLSYRGHPCRWDSLSCLESAWGCFLFPDYFKGKEKTPEYQKFFFGHLDSFIKNHEKIYPRISSNYEKLSMNNFSTARMECFLCQEIEHCAVCPINAAFSGSPLGKIPSHMCEIQKIKIKEKRKFQEALKSLH